MPEQAEIDELQELLFGHERVKQKRHSERTEQRLRALELRLSTADLASRLPEVVAEAASEHRSGLSNSLAPVIGPAISEAIQIALRRFAETLETIITRATSLNSLRWRVEAWRSGRPYSEIVLLNSFRYRVVAVYLLQRDSGLLLRCRSNSQRFSENGASYAGMLAALRDFALDLFKHNGKVHDQTETFSFRYQDFSCVMGTSGYYALAVLYHGEAGAVITKALRHALREVRDYPVQPIPGIVTDLSHYEPFDQILDHCFISEPVPPCATARMRWVRLGLAAAVAAAAIFAGEYYLKRFHSRREADFSTWRRQLEQRADITIDDVEKTNSHWQVVLHKDPESPGSLPPLPESIQERVQIIVQKEPVLNDTMTLRRINRILKPPLPAKVSLRDGHLMLQGEVPNAWAARAASTAPLILGVTSVDTSGLESYEQHRLDELVQEIYHEPTLRGRDEMMRYFRSKLDAFVEIDRLHHILGTDYFHLLTIAGTKHELEGLRKTAQTISGDMEWALQEAGILNIWPVRILPQIRAGDGGGIGISIATASAAQKARVRDE